MNEGNFVILRQRAACKQLLCLFENRFRLRLSATAKALLRIGDEFLMISCTLNEKKYTVDFVSGRALREMEPAAQMYGRIVAISNAALKGEVPEDAKNLSIGEALDVMIRWFCLLFGNQFTPDDVLDYYPVDRMMHDIALALMAVQTQTTEILDEFPTKAAKTEEAATLQS